MFWTYRLQRDKFGETALHIAIANDPTLEKIMKRLDRHENFGNERFSIWKKTNPMIKYADEGELHQMVFLQTIGGQVSQVQRAL